MEGPIRMPGAFLSTHNYDDNSIVFKPFATPSFYAPPSPSAASALSHSFQAISRASSTSTNNTRKRPRFDTQHSSLGTPRGRQTLQDSNEALSPAPLANTDYRIAGGLDTPCADKVREEEQNDLEREKDYRLNRYNRHTYPTDSYFPHTPAPDPAQPRKRRHSSAHAQAGWGKAVWELTGGVAGKVITFCWNTAFHGFHAGGGRGYHMQLDTPTVTAADMGYLDTTQDVFDAAYRARGTTPVPGGFPEDHLIQDYMSHPSSYQYNETPTQANDLATSSLRSNWVMVDDPYTDVETSPVRKRCRPSTAILHARPTPRQSPANRARLQGRPPTEGASFASPRASGASLAGPFRPTSSDGLLRQHKRSRSSIAPPRRMDYGVPETTSKSPDVIKFEKKLRRLDQRQDETMRRMNEQMQDLLRQGQEALAAKIEVSEELEDEGYGEGADDGWQRDRRQGS